MQRSQSRILTTHTGSCPTPRRADAALCAAVAGQAGGSTRLRSAKAGMRSGGSFPAQVEAGLDVINNGEQQRDSFALYLRHRLTGIGGESIRTRLRRHRRLSGVQGRVHPPGRHQGGGEQHRLPARRHRRRRLCRRPGLIEAECDDFAAALAPVAGRYAEAFLDRALARDHRLHRAEPALRDREGLSRGAGRGARGRVPAVVARGWVLQLDCPDLALERALLLP